ncbi:MAG: 4Fe-4S binding protein, partial [Anaerovorax sp.]
EIKMEPVVCAVDTPHCERDCIACRKACIYYAIEKEDGEIHIDRERCTGCGLCTFVCPDKKLTLQW